MPTRAVLTDMAVPLGRAVGNAVEVAESLEVLAGGGPADVVELTVALAREMLDLVGLHGRDPADTLRDGTAMDSFRALVAAQGGDATAALPVARHSETITAPRGGTMGTSMHWRWAWRCGGSARDVRSPVSGCRPGRGC